jgi:TonB family protein
MQQSMPTRGASATWVGGVYDKERRKLVIAIVLLMAAITAVLIRDRDAWFGNDNDETAAVDSNQTVSAPSAAVEPTPAPAVETKTPVAADHSTKTTSSHAPASQVRRTVRHAVNSAKPVTPDDSAAASAKSSATWGPATTATQRQATAVHAQAPQPEPYPLLTEATAVKGSVLLQALIRADGTVEELRVISGPTILVSAARQAVQQWRFKPYLMNGKPVETYARVTVNFSIDVSNTEARYHVNSVTSAGSL